MSEPVSISKTLSRVLDANLSFTKMATQMATTALESAFSAASTLATEVGPKAAAAIRQGIKQTQAVQQPAPSAEQKPATILLEGKTGTIATGFFVLQNSLPHEIATAIEVSPLIAFDGRRVDSALRFDPGTISLAAGEQVIARVTSKITRRLVAGLRYEGEILVPGVAGARIPIVLQRKPDAVPDKPLRKKAKPTIRAAKAAIKKAPPKKAAPTKKLTRKRSVR
jgi:hypothetical protein